MSSDDFNPKTPAVHGDKSISKARKWQKLAARVGSLDADVLAVIKGFLLLLGYTDEVANTFMSKRNRKIHNTGIDLPTMTLLLEDPRFFEGLQAVAPTDSITRDRFLKVLQTIAGAEWRISHTNRLANAVHGTISIKALAYILAAGASVGAEMSTLYAVWGQIQAPDPHTDLFFGEERGEDYRAVCTLPFLDTISLPLPKESGLEAIRCVFRWSQEVGDTINDIDANVVSIDWNGDVRDVCYHFKQELECQSGRQLPDEETKHLVALSHRRIERKKSVALAKSRRRSSLAVNTATALVRMETASTAHHCGLPETNFSGHSKLPSVASPPKPSTDGGNPSAVRSNTNGHAFHANRVIAAEEHTWAWDDAELGQEDQDSAKASSRGQPAGNFKRFAHKPHYRWFAEGFEFELDHCAPEVAAHVIVLNAPVSGQNLRTVSRVRMEVFNDRDELIADCPLDFKHVTGAECVIAVLQRAPVTKRDANATVQDMFYPQIIAEGARATDGSASSSTTPLASNNNGQPTATTVPSRSSTPLAPPTPLAPSTVRLKTAGSARSRGSRSGSASFFGELLETESATATATATDTLIPKQTEQQVGVATGPGSSACDAEVAEELGAPMFEPPPIFDEESLLSFEEYRMAHFGAAYQAQAGVRPETIGYEEFGLTRTTVGHNQVCTKIRTGWEFRAVCREVHRHDLFKEHAPRHFLCALPVVKEVLAESKILLVPSINPCDENGTFTSNANPAKKQSVKFAVDDDDAGTDGAQTSAPNAATQKLIDKLQRIDKTPTRSEVLTVGGKKSPPSQRSSPPLANSFSGATVPTPVDSSPSSPSDVLHTPGRSALGLAAGTAVSTTAHGNVQHSDAGDIRLYSPEERQAFRSRPIFNPFAMETGDLSVMQLGPDAPIWVLIRAR